MKKKKIIKLEGHNHDLFTIIGISSHEKGYTLTWALNNSMEMSFSRREDLEEIRPGNEETLHFPVFFFNDETRKISYFLIQNRSPEGFLVTEWPTFDFLLIIPELIESNLQKNLLSQLKKVPGIQAAFLMNPADISNPARLLIE
ncbi:MAG: IPExxxVDY family protein [Chlorobi bacterium]|nr:IPExxxVDY family protein [Chlorobiota bacterium]